MAPRKAAKQSEEDIEIVDKAAGAGDVLPSKRKKPAARAAKTEEEKEMRLPRAARVRKAESIQLTETDVAPAPVKQPVAMNTKRKAVPLKDSSTAMKTNSKSKTANRKGKDIDNEDIEAESEHTDVVQVNEGARTKSTRTKAAAKKAGVDVPEEAKAKPMGRSRKNVEGVEKSEEPITKRKRNAADTDATAQKEKPKPRTTRKKVNQVAEAKNELPSTKTSKVKESNVSQRSNEETNDNGSGQMNVRKTRTRNKKNMDKFTEETHLEQDNKKNQEDENNEPDAVESVKGPKRGRNVRKKDENVLQKDTVRPNDNQNEANKISKLPVKNSRVANKKLNSEKPTPTLAVAKKTRGKKAEAVQETLPEIDEGSEEMGEIRLEQHSNETGEVENVGPDAVEPMKTAKKGRNVRKKDGSVPPKNITKTRGKAAGADVAPNQDHTSIEKPVKDLRTTVNKGNSTAKAVPATVPFTAGENAEETMHLEDSSAEKEIIDEKKRSLDESVTLATNNNMEELTKENGHDQTLPTDSKGNDETFEIFSEIDEKLPEETNGTSFEYDGSYVHTIKEEN